MAWWSRNPKVHRRFSLKTWTVRRWKSTFRLRAAVRTWLYNVSVVTVAVYAALWVITYVG